MDNYDEKCIELEKKCTKDWINLSFDLSDECDLYGIHGVECYLDDYQSILVATMKLPKEQSVSCSYDEDGNIKYEGKLKELLSALITKWNKYPEIKNVQLSNVGDENAIDILCDVDISSLEEDLEYEPLTDDEIPKIIPVPKDVDLSNCSKTYVVNYTYSQFNEGLGGYYGTELFDTYKDAYRYFDKKRKEKGVCECYLRLNAHDDFCESEYTYTLYEVIKESATTTPIEESEEDNVEYQVYYTNTSTKEAGPRGEYEYEEQRFNNEEDAKKFAYDLKNNFACYALEINKLVNGEISEQLKAWSLGKDGRWIEFDCASGKPLKEMNNTELSQERETVKYGTPRYKEIECIEMINSILAYNYVKELNGGDRSTIVSDLMTPNNYKARYLKQYIDELGEEKVKELIQGQIDDIDKVVVGTDYEISGGPYNSIHWVSSRSKHNASFKQLTFPKDKDKGVREWYMKEYPTDDFGEEIPETTTFETVFNALKNGEDVYDYLVGDSVVRERVFDELSNILGCDYDDIYYAWLGESLTSKNIKRSLEEKRSHRTLRQHNKINERAVRNHKHIFENNSDEVKTEETDEGNTIVIPDFEIDLSKLLGEDFNDTEFSTVEYDPNNDEITIEGVYHYREKDLHFGWTIPIESLTGDGRSWFADYFDYMCDDLYPCENGEEVDLSDYDFVWVSDNDKRASNSKLGTDNDDGNFYYTNDDLKAYYEYQPIYCYVCFDPDSKGIKTWNEFIAWCEGKDLEYYSDIEEVYRTN